MEGDRIVTDPRTRRLFPREAVVRPSVLFCGHCGRAPAETPPTVPESRVCRRCGMGLMLRAPADAAPSVSDPFLVVNGALTVCGMSREAERLLDVEETVAVNRHVGEFLAPADAEAPTGENLAALLSWAVRGDAPPRSVCVRPANVFGVRYWARIGACGPPRAALVVLADA
jgi:hypothetical protein